MRKELVARQGEKEKKGGIAWFELGGMARVEISSEDPLQPIESALQPVGAPGWRAAEPGPQMIRLVFDEPQRVTRLYLLFNEEERSRTQEFVLRYSQDQGKNYREIVRQQYSFSPPGTTTEQEEYEVDLFGVTALELDITPDISGGPAKASLGRLLVA